MIRKILFSFLIFFVGFCATTNGQVGCPPNLDFEFGDLGYWHFYRGTVATGPVYSVTSCPPVLGLHTLTAGSGVDKYGGFKIVDTSGGFFALRIGKDSNLFNTDRAQYFVHVPSGSTHYSLIYRFAVVLELPEPVTSHTTAEQPSFLAVAYDSSTGIPVRCAADTFYGNSPSSGLIASPVISAIAGNGFDVKYKSWSTVSVDLSGMAGKTVGIQFTAAGCSLGGHFGYGYIDMTCGLFAVQSKICDDTLATLSGPPGFEDYKWYDSVTFRHLYGTTQVITMPIPDTTTTFAVVVQPFVGFGCPDTLYTRITPSYLAMKASHDTMICEKASVRLYAGATDSAIAMPLTYTWSPAIGLTCTTCDNPTATPLTSTSYIVKVTDKAGCSKVDTVTVKIDPVTSTLSKVNDSCNGFNNGSAKVTPLTGIAPFSYIWSTFPLQTGITATGLTAGTYTVTVTDNLGCKDNEIAVISQPPPNNLSITGTARPTNCFGADGYIALSGLTAGKIYKYTYTFKGVPQTYSSTAFAGGVDTIRGLKEGLYDDLTVDVMGLPRPRCPFNTVGPVTLKDPPIPPLPAVGSNGPICKGDTLKLSAKDAVPGVFFQWTGPSGFLWNLPDTVIPNADFIQAGTYSVTVSIHGCQSTNTAVVVIKPIPAPSAVGDTACTGSDINLSASSANGADKYRWAGPDAYYSDKQNPVVKNATMNAAGTYTVIATLNGCSSRTTTDVTVVQTPGLPRVTDTAYCQYDSPVSPLAAIGSDAGILTWYNAAGIVYPGNPIPATDVPGVTTWYVDDRVVGPGLGNPVVCVSPKAAAVVTVYAKYFPALAVTDTNICTGNDITFTVNNMGDDKDGIRWSMAVGDSIRDVNPLKHAFDAIGTYTISVTPLHKFCPNPTLTKVINVFPYPVLNLGPDTSICLGGRSLTLGDDININNPKAKWLWNTNETSPSIVVTKPGIYYSRLLINGCPVTDTVTVLNDCYIDVPNAFTPNGDGTNDYFFPRQFLSKGLIGFRMDIYNRWGQMIFSSNSLNGLGWDGKFNNVLQPEGVYVYRIEATFKDGQVEHHTGNLTLLR